MKSQYLLAVIVFASMAISGCSCTSRSKVKALLRDSGERWFLVGTYVTPREKEGPPKEEWIGTLRLPDGVLSRVIDIPVKTSDGTLLWSVAAYNEVSQILILEALGSSGEHDCIDVWLYDLASRQSRLIAKGKWDNICGFVWSPDGSKVAFVASTRGSETAIMRYEEGGDNTALNKLMDRRDNKYLYYVSKDDDVMCVKMRTAVMQYDVHTGKLEEVASDAWRFGNSSFKPRRPVYSEDGNWLYYVSGDRHVMRVDLRTRECTKLPFSHAIVILTVKGEYLIYARQVGAREDWRFEVVKVRLDSPDGLAGEQVVYADKGVIWQNDVSPSRRFILLRSRMGYGSDTRLLDVDKGTVYRADFLLFHYGFCPCSTVFVRGTVP